MVPPLGPVEASLGERSAAPGQLVNVDSQLEKSLHAPLRRLELGGKQPLTLQGVEERDTECSREVVVTRPRRL